MQFKITNLLLCLTALLALTTASPTTDNLFHGPDFKCPKGKDGYCCKKEGGLTSDPGNCRKSVWSDDVDKADFKEVLGESPWVGCLTGEFSMCRVNSDNPPAHHSAKPTGTQSLSALTVETPSSIEVASSTGTLSPTETLTSTEASTSTEVPASTEVPSSSEALSTTNTSHLTEAPSFTEAPFLIEATSPTEPASTTEAPSPTETLAPVQS